jgi:bacillithiol system protein YtxJ
MNWNTITAESQLETIKEESFVQPILIFKHSTRCSISATALNRFERNYNQGEVADLKPYYLDLIAHRSISGQVAQNFGVQHESPQILMIHNGKSVYDASHYDISFANLKEKLAIGV